MTKDEELDQLRAEKTALCEALRRKDEELEQSRQANENLREGLKQAIMAIEYLQERVKGNRPEIATIVVCLLPPTVLCVHPSYLSTLRKQGVELLSALGHTL